MLSACSQVSRTSGLLRLRAEVGLVSLFSPWQWGAPPSPTVRGALRRPGTPPSPICLRGGTFSLLLLLFPPPRLHLPPPPSMVCPLQASSNLSIFSSRAYFFCPQQTSVCTPGGSWALSPLSSIFIRLMLQGAFDWQCGGCEYV